ncbi:MAG: TerB family tellurite resistance protein [Rhodospirillaceae bacterium]|nr:TerB family tellurite resistance protein [Rhodospirillaceae bacterium]
MLNRLKDLLLDGPAGAESAPHAYTQEELGMAAAALLVEAARMDESFDEEERDRIIQLVCWRFGLGEEDAGLLVDRAAAATDGATQLHRFAHTVRQACDPAQRIRMIEMMWDVACADGQLHPMESHLIHRVAGMLFVDERDNGAARKRAIDRYGITDPAG